MRTGRLLAAVVMIAVVANACSKKSDDAPSTATEYTKKESTELNQTNALSESEQAAKKAKEDEENRLMKAAIAATAKRVAALKNATDSLDIAEILAQLSQMGEKAVSAAPAIKPLLESKEADVKAAALACWAKIKGKAGRPEIEAALKDADENARRAAMEVWSAVGGSDIGPIVGMLKDIDAGVQGEAMKFLKAQKLDDATVVEIAKRAEDLESQAAKIAVPLLGEHRAIVPKFDEVILALSKHRDAEVRVLAIRAINEYDIKNYAIAKRLVLNMGDDEDKNVRGESWRVVRRWGNNQCPAYDPDAGEEDLKLMCSDWKKWLDDNRKTLGL